MRHLSNFKPAKNGTSKETRQFKQLKSIVRYLSKSDDALTIPEIAEHAKISVPTGTKLIKELLDKGLVIEDGKKEVENGRRPNILHLKKRAILRSRRRGTRKVDSRQC